MTTTRKTWDHWRDNAEGSRYIIEGLRFSHLDGVYRKAVELGFDGCDETIKHRLKQGITTWAELTKPVNRGQSESGKRAYTSKHSEMAAVIAALDARKKAMGLK